MADSTPVVELRGATVRVGGGRTVLGPLDLVVAPGEHWAVLGPNGAGKTTLLALAGGRRHPFDGWATILGERVGRTDLRALRSRIGLMSHAVADQLRPGIPVLDVVLGGASGALETWWDTVDDQARADARALLDTVGCAGVADQAFAACSQGERQRVLLARAHFGRPELLLLDEPAAGLDVAGRELLVGALESTARGLGATTSLLVTHHLEELPSTTTHALLLRAGRPVAAGPVEDVLLGAPLTECFGLPLHVHRAGRRWQVTTQP